MYVTQFLVAREKFQKISKEINTHFIFNNFFSKILQFMRQCGKMW
jgi:hypothetical protein